jgi:hypothetical protein
MPIVVAVVVAAATLMLLLIVLGPSRRIRREAHIAESDYLSVMAHEAEESIGDVDADVPWDDEDDGDDESGPSLGDVPVP